MYLIYSRIVNKFFPIPFQNGRLGKQKKLLHSFADKVTHKNTNITRNPRRDGQEGGREGGRGGGCILSSDHHGLCDCGFCKRRTVYSLFLVASLAPTAVFQAFH